MGDINRWAVIPNHNVPKHIATVKIVTERAEAERIAMETSSTIMPALDVDRLLEYQAEIEGQN